MTYGKPKHTRLRDIFSTGMEKGKRHVLRPCMAASRKRADKVIIFLQAYAHGECEAKKKTFIRFWSASYFTLLHGIFNMISLPESKDRM